MSEGGEKEVRVDSTLSKGILILETLAQAGGRKSVTEISHELKLTKSNVFRLLQTLSRLGYVRQTDDRLYSATLRAWQIGRNMVENLNLREIAAPQMQFLSEKTGHTVYLAVPDNLSVVYIDKIESSQPIRSWNPVGGAAPIHAVSTGKAIIAADYASWRGKVRNHLARHTALTITTAEALDEDVERIRTCGYAEDHGEFRDQVIGFGAAILLPDSKPVGAIGISLPEVNMPEGKHAFFGKIVRQAAQEITDHLARR